LRLVHLSDLHVQLDWHRRSLWRSGWRGAPGRFELHALGRRHQFVDAADRVRRLVDATLELEPDQVLVSGDLTALGDEAELDEARRLLEPLAATGRLIVVPGNHDRYTDVPQARRFERHFGAMLQSDLPEYADAHGYPFVKLLGERFAVIGLDSTRVLGWGHYVVGRVGRPQREALARLLDDPRLAGRTLIVVAHHGPSGPSGRFDWKESGLLDAGPLLGLLHERPAMLLHGHSHHRYWHRANAGVPHQFGGGSSTFGKSAAFWHLELDDHQDIEARVLPLR
jgi:3',5'-cyclic AMP phosphodiesterase CpdA